MARTTVKKMQNTVVEKRTSKAEKFNIRNNCVEKSLIPRKTLRGSYRLKSKESSS
jgi:hypothetical protein